MVRIFTKFIWLNKIGADTRKPRKEKLIDGGKGGVVLFGGLLELSCFNTWG